MRFLRTLLVMTTVGSLLFLLPACNCRFLSDGEESSLENPPQTTEVAPGSQITHPLIWRGTGDQTLRLFSAFESEEAVAFARDLVARGAEAVRVERHTRLQSDGTGRDQFLVMAGDSLSQTEAENLRTALEAWNLSAEITTITAEPALVFDYTIAGGETVREMLPDFEYIHPFTRLVWEERDYRLALHVPSSFEGEPFPGPLFLLEGRECRLVSDRVWGWDFSPDGRFIAFGQSVLVQEVGADERVVDKTDAIAKEWGIAPEELRAATFHDGFKGDGFVILLFVYDCETQEYLCTTGVGGGIVNWRGDGIVFTRIPDGWVGPPADSLQCYDLASGKTTPCSSDVWIVRPERPSFNEPVEEDERVVIDRFPEAVNQIVIERAGRDRYVYWRRGS